MDQAQADHSKKTQGSLESKDRQLGTSPSQETSGGAVFHYNQGGFEASCLSDRLQTHSKLLAFALQIPEKDPRCFQFRASAMCSSLLLWMSKLVPTEDEGEWWALVEIQEEDEERPVLVILISRTEAPSLHLSKSLFLQLQTPKSPALHLNGARLQI